MAKQKEQSEFIKTQAEAARFLETSTRTIRRWTSEGLAKTEQGYRKKDLIKWQLNKGRPPTETRERIQTAEADFKETKAKLLEYDLKVKKGQLIDIEEVERRKIKQIIVAKRILLSLPRKLPTLLKNKSTKKMKQVIKGEVDRCLDILAGIKEEKNL